MPKPDLILLALEDSPILNLMDRVLRAVNYETAIAKNTPALGRVLQENSPALILIGEKYDGHEGIKIAREIRERFPTMPILIYTEKPQPDLIKGIFRLGMGGYLSPPLRTDDIVDAVESGIKNAHRVGDWLRREVKRTTASLQKRAQISEAERARLETVFNNIQDCVMILDGENRVILLNPAMCRTFGLDESFSHGQARPGCSHASRYAGTALQNGLKRSTAIS